MTKLKVLIVDDEPMAQKILEIYCQRIPAIEVVALCNNAIEAMPSLQNATIDLVFIDINMPEISGIELVRTLKGKAAIVFTTAYSEYAVESYELNALDYLLKPISFERFFASIAKAMKQHPETLPDAENILEDTILDADNSFFVKSNGKRVRIELNDLLYVEGLKDYVKLCSKDEKIIVHGSLKKIETYLSKYPAFVRVHKSYIINISKIRDFDSEEIRLRGDATVIPVGQTYFSDLEKAIAGKRY